MKAPERLPRSPNGTQVPRALTSSHQPPLALQLHLESSFPNHLGEKPGTAARSRGQPKRTHSSGHIPRAAVHTGGFNSGRKSTQSNFYNSDGTVIASKHLAKDYTRFKTIYHSIPFMRKIPGTFKYAYICKQPIY